MNRVVGSVTVVIPARNEAATVRGVIAAVRGHPTVARVILVDNGSSDDTASVASDVGADVMVEPVQGLGRAVKRALGEVDTAYVLRTDADISNWNADWLDLLCDPRKRGLTRAVFTSPYDQFPVTRLVVRPYLDAFVPQLASLHTPISGTYFFKLADVDWPRLPDDWAFDIALVVGAYEAGLSLHEVDIGVLSDKPRDIDHYEPMARDIHRYFLAKFTMARPRSS